MASLLSDVSDADVGILVACCLVALLACCCCWHVAGVGMLARMRCVTDTQVLWRDSAACVW